MAIERLKGVEGGWIQHHSAVDRSKGGIIRFRRLRGRRVEQLDEATSYVGDIREVLGWTRRQTPAVPSLQPAKVRASYLRLT